MNSDFVYDLMFFHVQYTVGDLYKLRRVSKHFKRITEYQLRKLIEYKITPSQDLFSSESTFSGTFIDTEGGHNPYEKDPFKIRNSYWSDDDSDDSNCNYHWTNQNNNLRRKMIDIKPCYGNGISNIIDHYKSNILPITGIKLTKPFENDTTFDLFPNLVSLNINNIKGSIRIFRTEEEVKKLGVTTNKTTITKITKCITIPTSLVSLRRLYCSNTDISSIPGTLINLVTLYCDFNNISVIPNTLINLKTLSCSNNKIGSIPNTLTKLKKLQCNSNKLLSLPSTLKKLHTLYCSENSITRIPNTFTRVTELYCDNNDIKIIPDTLIRLERLYCSFNSILKIPNTLTRLRELDCSHNILKKLPNTLINLSILDCSYNYIPSIPREYTSLYDVDARGNVPRTVILCDNNFETKLT